MHVFEIIDGIRKRPAFYLDNEPSLKRLRSFLLGCEYGFTSCEEQLDGMGELRKFNDWVAKQLGFAEATSGWCNMISAKVASDEQALQRFFELLDQFRANQKLP